MVQLIMKYFIGYVFENGGEIVDGPLVGKYDNGFKYYKWKVKCPNCLVETWKFSNTLKSLIYPCKRCYDNSMKKFDSTPAIKRAFISLKSNAKSRNISVTISEEDFFYMASKNCHYCDSPPIYKNGPKEWQKRVLLNGIDRVDNNFGYSMDNIVSCCEQCNWAKKDLTIEEWNKWIDMLLKNREKNDTN